MDNKGQTLIAFILLLPVVLLLMAIVIDVGNFLVIKNEYENEIKDTIRYSLKRNLDEEKIRNLLDNNIEGQKEVIIKNNVLKVKVNDKINSIFSIIKFDYNIDASYIGYKNGEKIIIKKE